MRARYYDPATAQFLTVDPLGREDRITLRLRQAKPHGLTDPSGLVTVGLCFGVAAALIFGRAWTVCPIVAALDTRTHHVTMGSTSTWAHNLGSPALGVSLTDEFSDAQNIRQLGGKFDEGGASAPVGEVPVTAGGFYGHCADAPGGAVIGGGAGLGAGPQFLPPVEGHYGVSNTQLKTWFGDDIGKEVKQ